MKKTIAVLVLALGFIFTAQAQKGKRSNQQFTIQQQTALAVKKMTLQLDLSTSQQHQIKPLLADKIAKRKERKAIKKAGKKQAKLSINERFDKEMQILDAKIAFKSEMKRILNEHQYEQFQKISNYRMLQNKKRMKHKKHQKKEKNN